MSNKLGIGDKFPSMTINLVNGGTINLPESLDSKYGVVLFYRGHWWPYCRRQLGGFAENKKQLDEAGVKVFAASIDNFDNAKEVANDLNFPVGYEVTRDIADQIGAWWEERRQIIQPSEFIIGQDNNIIVSSYSDGPLGRMDATDVIKLANFFTSRE